MLHVQVHYPKFTLDFSQEQVCMAHIKVLAKALEGFWEKNRLKDT